MPLIQLVLRRYPLAIAAIKRRYEMYNEQIRYIRQRAREGKAFIIRPFAELGIGSVCHDRKELRRVYDLGRRAAEERIDELIAWMAER